MVAGLNNRLCEWRQRNKLTQAELAAAISVSRKTINTIENGVFTPSTLLALKLAQVFACTVEELFWLNPEHTPDKNP